MSYDELRERVRNLTGLEGKDADLVTADIYAVAGDDPVSPAVIAHAAELRGFGQPAAAPVATKDEQLSEQIGAGITMDPAKVLLGVYENSPRVACERVPVIGRAPTEAQQLIGDALDELPDEIRLLLCKIDVFEDTATFWLWDEANEIDRPVGPIDLKPFQTGEALHDAFMALLQRLRRVLAADSN